MRRQPQVQQGSKAVKELMAHIMLVKLGVAMAS